MVTVETAPVVSVIIPVYNDADGLRTCLQALAGQHYPRDRFEVIVVDNNSVQDIARVCAAFERVHYPHEQRPGSYAARNKGLSCATGQILAFTDADCIPDAAWLRSGVAALKEGADIVGGRVQLFSEAPGSPGLAARYEMAHELRNETLIPHHNFAVTANLFTTRAVMNAVGDFDASLASGGDHEWGVRATSQGFDLQYASRAVVLHPTRSLGSVIRKAVRVAKGIYENEKRKATVRGMVGYTRYELGLTVRETTNHLKDSDPMLAAFTAGMHLLEIGIVNLCFLRNQVFNGNAGKS